MDLNILSLAPIAYFIHIIVKTGRFVRSATRYLPAPSTFARFILGNVIFIAYVLTPVFLATFYQGEWMLVHGLSTAAIIPSVDFLILIDLVNARSIPCLC